MRIILTDPTKDVGMASINQELRKSKGTAIEDDIMLVLANAEATAGNLNKAVELLEELADQNEARKIDTAFWWVGSYSPPEQRVAEQVQEYYSKSPDFTSDHALLMLSKFYSKMNRPAERWDCLERLRCKYPDGDRLKQDSETLKPLMKLAYPAENGRFPANDSTPLLEYRRPHFTCLRIQSDICLDKNPGEIVTLRILREFVERYQALMTAEELRKYAGAGTDIAEKLSILGDERQKAEVHAAILVFEMALKELEEEGKKAEGEQ